MSGADRTCGPPAGSDCAESLLHVTEFVIGDACARPVGGQIRPPAHVIRRTGPTPAAPTTMAPTTNWQHGCAVKWTGAQQLWLVPRFRSGTPESVSPVSRRRNSRRSWPRSAWAAWGLSTIRPATKLRSSQERSWTAMPLGRVTRADPRLGRSAYGQGAHHASLPKSARGTTGTPPARGEALHGADHGRITTLNLIPLCRRLFRSSRSYHSGLAYGARNSGIVHSGISGSQGASPVDRISGGGSGRSRDSRQLVRSNSTRFVLRNSIRFVPASFVRFVPPSAIRTAELGFI
ncbi:hypothetical protein ABIA39_003108 [Nocardia sp. GAS34]